MPDYTFTGSQTFIYTSVQLADGSTLEAVPGEVYTLDEAPDALFVPVAAGATVTPIAPIATAADFEAASEPSDTPPATPAA